MRCWEIMIMVIQVRGYVDNPTCLISSHPPFNLFPPPNHLKLLPSTHHIPSQSTTITHSHHPPSQSTTIHHTLPPPAHHTTGGPQAEIDRTSIDDYWVMPTQYYSKSFAIPGGGLLSIVFVDTTTLAPSVNQCCNEKGIYS